MAEALMSSDQVTLQSSLMKSVEIVGAQFPASAVAPDELMADHEKAASNRQDGSFLCSTCRHEYGLEGMESTRDERTLWTDRVETSADLQARGRWCSNIQKMQTAITALR